MKSENRELNYLEVLKKVEKLSGIEKKYYYYLPDVCWKSEETQAKELKISRKKLIRLKRNLINEGILELVLKPNGKRLNPKHLLLKRIPIILRQIELSYFRYSIDDSIYYIKDINWSLLQSYSAEEINRLSRMDVIKLYMDCGFIVLPTHYPIFEDKGVKCSCINEYKCSNKGKHPVFRYKHIDSYNYENLKKNYLNYFKDNPKLNIGFKVLGFSVLDVDFRYRGDFTLKYLMDEYEFDLKENLTARSGGGTHFYLADKDLQNLPNALGDGLDLRSEGGVIMAPGSIHYSGKKYEWDLIGNPANLPIETFEPELSNNEKSNLDFKNRINKIKLKDITLPKLLTSDYVIEKGKRELTLFKWGCRERGKGANAEQIYNILISIRDTYCENENDPVSDQEVRNIADSAAAYPTNQEKRLMSLKP